MGGCLQICHNVELLAKHVTHTGDLTLFLSLSMNLPAAVHHRLIADIDLQATVFAPPDEAGRRPSVLFCKS